MAGRIKDQAEEFHKEQVVESSTWAVGTMLFWAIVVEKQTVYLDD